MLPGHHGGRTSRVLKSSLSATSHTCIGLSCLLLLPSGLPGLQQGVDIILFAARQLRRRSPSLKMSFSLLISTRRLIWFYKLVKHFSIVKADLILWVHLTLPCAEALHSTMQDRFLPRCIAGRIQIAFTTTVHTPTGTS